MGISNAQRREDSLPPRKRASTSPPPTGPTDTPFMQEARMRFKQACEADKKQDAREREALKFYNNEQWPDDIKALRAGNSGTDGMPPTPARPCLTINKVKQPVLQVLNQERQSDIGIEIVPADDFESLIGPIDDTEIELREGLTRRIQRTSEAQDGRTWAFQRAAIAGRGFYRVLTRYMRGKTSQQEVAVSRIFNQGAVKIDPAHEQPDGSDADWAFVGSWISWDRYKATYPRKATQNGTARNPALDYDGEDSFLTLCEQYPEWFKAENAPDGVTNRAVHISEYIYCTYESRVLLTLPDDTDVWEDEVDKATAATAIDRRDVPERVFKWAKIDGLQVLDETDWPIPFTGIIKVLFEEVQPYDEERRVKGMVEDAMDSNRGFNAMASKLVESVALAPIPPLQLAEGQDEGYEREYQMAMTRTIPLQHYNQTDLANQPAPPPFATNRDVPIAPVAAGLEMFAMAIQDTTATHDSALGKTETNVKSARHARLLAEESRQGNSHGLDNLARSVRHEGEVINALLYPIYGRRPGRLAYLMTGEGDSQPVLIGQPFTMNGKRPQRAERGAQNAKTYQLTEHARFNVAIKVTKQYDTRRDQQRSELGELISAEPQMMTWFGDLFFKSSDGPGHKEMAERARVMLAPPIQEMLAAKAEGRQPMDPLAQAKIAEAQQMVQQATKVINELNTKIQTDWAKQQNENARAEHDNATKFEIAKVNAARDVQIEQAKAHLAIELQKLKMAQENLTREDTQAHEVGMAGAQAVQAAEQARVQAEMLAEQGMQDATIDRMASERGHEQALEQGEVGHQQSLEAQEQAAALAPEPEGVGA